MIYRIHSALYEKANRRRRQEWDLALRDLNHDRGGATTSLTVYHGQNDGVDLVISEPGGEPAIIPLSAEALGGHFTAYDDIIRRMAACARGDTEARSLETLDYAKKLIHDEAGEMVQEALEDHVEVELAEARRLFTLIFLVCTQLPESLVTFHRVHR